MADVQADPPRAARRERSAAAPGRARARRFPLSPAARLLEHELSTGGLEQQERLSLGAIDVEIALGSDSLWAIVRRDTGGAIALRAAFLPGGAFSIRSRVNKADCRASVEIESVLGAHRIDLSLGRAALPQLALTARLTPREDLLVPHLPRDLYPLGAHDMLDAQGEVEAAQRGLNSGLCYLRVTKPAFGSVLYFQNLTALNPYFLATNSKPDGAVGGEWPELGYLPPTPPRGTPPADPLPAGVETVMSDVRLVFHEDPDPDERLSALRFLQMLGSVYRTIERPGTAFRDWPGRARRTLGDLDRAPEATVRHYGHRYARPYTDAEYPDSMVQLSLVAALHEWGAWSGSPPPLKKAFASGLRKFHDRQRRALRRYLPNVGKEKDADAVDSWYLYHPLLNLGRLALDGDRRARGLLLDSLPFAIEAARHFDYAWPIQYRMSDFGVITAARDDDGLGQTDVGGLYAYVLLQAHALTGDPAHIAEARAAIDAARDMRFELNYQANLTAWGAAACARLWRITEDERYLEQGYVYLASFFHNAEIWQSRIAHARHFNNFLAVTALHDAPYMALYECFDSFSAFEHYLKDSGPALDPAARMLVSEYCRYALDRAWFYYPDVLPPEALAEESRNGHIDRALSFPLEDLYPDGQPAGQVGQEIYGAGAAFAFAVRSFHRIEGAPFRLFCDHFLLARDRPAGDALEIELSGGEGCTALLGLVRLPRRSLDGIQVSLADGERIRARPAGDDRLEFRVPATGRVTIRWPI